MGPLTELLTRAPLPSEQALSIAAQLAASLRARGAPHLHLSASAIEVGWDADRPLIVVSEPTAPAETTYLAPEQWSGGAVDARADVYATSAILFHLLVGRPPSRPLSGDDLAALPASLRPLLERALAHDPAQRPADAGTLFESLLRAHQAQAQSGVSRAALWVGLAALALVLGGGGVVLTLSGGDWSTALLERVGLHDATGRTRDAVSADTGRRAQPGHPQTTPGRVVVEGVEVAVTGRAPDAAPADTGRAPDAAPADTGRAPDAAPADTGRAPDARAEAPPTPRSSPSPPSPALEPASPAEADHVPSPAPVDVTPTNTHAAPVDTGRAPDAAPADTGRAPDAAPVDTGRAPDAAPVDTGRAPDAAPVDTGRTPDAAPVDTGRVDPTQTELPPPPPPTLDPALHRLPDGREVSLQIVSAGPVVLESGGRVSVRAFRIEAEPARLAELARYLDARLAAGQPIGGFLPAGEQGDALRRYLNTGAAVGDEPLERLDPESEAAFLDWRGLRVLKPEQRARAEVVLGSAVEGVRGALPLR